MSPIALNEQNNGGDQKDSRYHASSSEAAFKAEAQYAAHNYHPLEVVFARAKGVEVWDPVSYLQNISENHAHNL